MAIAHDTQRFLHFNLDHTDAGEDNHYVDIAQLLSHANRRFYRQGMTYHVANIVFDDADGDADIDVCTLPNTWSMQEAWRLGFTAWLAQQRAAMKSLGENDLGTWSDFKVYLNNAHLTAETASPKVDIATLIDVNANTFPAGNWAYSQYVTESDDDVYIWAMGANAGTYPSYSAISLLDQLEMVMQVPTADPVFGNDSQATQSVYSLLSTDQTDDGIIQDVIEDIIEQNPLPPYDADVVAGAGTAGSGRPSSPWVARTCMIKGGQTTSSAVAAVGGFAVPCGLLMIESNSSEEDNSIGVTIELVPGEYKGVSAVPMRGGGF